MKRMNVVSMTGAIIVTAIVVAIAQIRSGFVPPEEAVRVFLVQNFVAFLAAMMYEFLPGYSRYIFRISVLGGMAYTILLGDSKTEIAQGLGITVISIVAAAVFLLLRDKPPKS